MLVLDFTFCKMILSKQFMFESKSQNEEEKAIFEENTPIKGNNSDILFTLK